MDYNLKITPIYIDGKIVKNLFECPICGDNEACTRVYRPIEDSGLDEIMCSECDARFTPLNYEWKLDSTWTLEE